MLCRNYYVNASDGALTTLQFLIGLDLAARLHQLSGRQVKRPNQQHQSTEQNGIAATIVGANT